ncbi:MAG: hypothetical protein DMF74_22390 [Acidobacteria bacterium]|nr:MAG: hypothetical protein DMF74_22390 [Acidobacteriota bacterium]
MKVLEKNGFILTKRIGNQRYKYVLIVHPTVAVQRLRERAKVNDVLWDAFRARQIEVKDDTYEERQKKKNANVIPIASAKTG